MVTALNCSVWRGRLQLVLVLIWHWCWGELTRGRDPVIDVHGDKQGRTLARRRCEDAMVRSAPQLQLFSPPSRGAGSGKVVMLGRGELRPEGRPAAEGRPEREPGAKARRLMDWVARPSVWVAPGGGRIVFGRPLIPSPSPRRAGARGAGRGSSDQRSG